MFDVFTEEIEVQIKSGIANLYWYKGDLKKAWLRSGVPEAICEALFQKRKEDGSAYSKRELMDMLYEELRSYDYNRRLEISRNFVRILIEHANFIPASEKHRIDIAERSALKLREIISRQQNEAETRSNYKRHLQQSSNPDYYSRLDQLRNEFFKAMNLPPQKRGYELEKIFCSLMAISGVPYERPYKITGEQIDSAIKYEGHFYLIELKWVESKADQRTIASLYMKVEGKLESRGIFISMQGYTDEVLSSLPRGKSIKVLLLDGVHLTNVITGIYTFQDLLNHAICYATLRGEIYCPHEIA